MITHAILVVSYSGGVRLAKTAPPRLRRGVGEIALKLAIIIPDACFSSPLIDVAVVTQSGDVATDQLTVDVESATGPEDL